MPLSKQEAPESWQQGGSTGIPRNKLSSGICSPQEGARATKPCWGMSDMSGPSSTEFYSHGLCSHSCKDTAPIVWLSSGQMNQWSWLCGEISWCPNLTPEAVSPFGFSVQPTLTAPSVISRPVTETSYGSLLDMQHLSPVPHHWLRTSIFVRLCMHVAVWESHG